MLLNNRYEVFNSKLVNGRDKTIISCLEFIREYLMNRVCNVMKVLNKCAGPLSPIDTRILESNTTLASQYQARWNEVKSIRLSAHGMINMWLKWIKRIVIVESKSLEFHGSMQLQPSMKWKTMVKIWENYTPICIRCTGLIHGKRCTLLMWSLSKVDPCGLKKTAQQLISLHLTTK